MEQIAESISKFIEGALGVDGWEMLIQIAATLLLFLVIRLFFWNNVTNFLDKRKELMSSEMELAESASSEAQQLKAIAEKELNEVRLNARGMIEDAKERGETERVKIIGKAKDDASKVMENAKVEINSEIEKARTSINDEIVSVATLMAEKIIKKEIDQEKHKDLIKEVTKEVAS